jgi:hypothetical protein
LFIGDPQSDTSKGQFNRAQIKTRNSIERTFGVVKHRLPVLATGLRKKMMHEAPKFVIAAFILHNLCLKYGDRGDDFSDGEGGDDNLRQEVYNPPVDQNLAVGGQAKDRRRNQLLKCFEK